MLGADHYREAERLLAHSKNHVDTGHEADRHIADIAAAQAQAHATLAHAAALVEAAAAGDGFMHIGVPNASDPELNGAPYPGGPWGRAFYGDRHLISIDKD